MTTTTKGPKSQTPTEDPFAYVKDMNEQLLDQVRATTGQYLDLYDKAVDRTIDLERKLAVASKPEWLVGIVNAHADVARDIADTYTATARGLLK